MHEAVIAEAARAVRTARALLVTAGAGMGVDSGLPDFRGNEGFWRAYPPFRALGLSFVDLANPAWFERDPELAWGFYGHRLHLYQRTQPHAGFARLRAWAARCAGGAHVFTSNVDGQFQRAGFDAVIECHGSLGHLQCTRGCGAGITPVGDLRIEVDPETFRARAPLPRCACGALARPNVLMFGDFGQYLSTGATEAAKWPVLGANEPTLKDPEPRPAEWVTIGFNPARKLYCSYVAIAGAANSTPPTAWGQALVPNTGINRQQPWVYVTAECDWNRGNPLNSLYGMSAVQTVMVVQNEGK